ncbi:MAG: hypothetical protein JWL83_605 [Actinomycetia bacterium]|nr:hypothetical protein [Actinomycetes bacterium]
MVSDQTHPARAARRRWRGATLAISLLLLVSCAPAPQRSATPPYLFDEEFNTTTLDLAKWQPNWLGPNNSSITKPVNGEERSCYDPAQVSVSGGALHLTAVQRTCLNWEYASGLVNTRAHFSFTYGYIEARVLVPGNGPTTNWPAVWADGMGHWPKTGEIDVMEGLAGKNCFHMHSKHHDEGGCANISPASGWHTFGADWRKGKVTFFYDGTQVGTITHGVTGKPMYLILDLGVSSSVSPPVVVPSGMAVDYIRVSR